MSRFILRYRGEGPKPEGDVDRVRSLRKASILDESPPRMLLVEGPEAGLKALVASMPEWVISRERSVPLPDPRMKIKTGEKKEGRERTSSDRSDSGESGRWVRRS